MKIRCKIESVVEVNFKKLLVKIVNLIFKYFLNSYFIECGWRCSKIQKNMIINYLSNMIFLILEGFNYYIEK